MNTPHCFFTSTAPTSLPSVSWASLLIFQIPQSEPSLPFSEVSFFAKTLGHLNLGQKPWLLQLGECSSPSCLLSHAGLSQGHPNLLHSSIPYIYEKPETIVRPSPAYGETYSVISSVSPGFPPGLYPYLWKVETTLIFLWITISLKQEKESCIVYTKNKEKQEQFILLLSLVSD